MTRTYHVVWTEDGTRRSEAGLAQQQAEKMVDELTRSGVDDAFYAVDYTAEMYERDRKARERSGR